MEDAQIYNLGIAVAYAQIIRAERTGRSLPERRCCPRCSGTATAERLR